MVYLICMAKKTKKKAKKKLKSPKNKELCNKIRYLNILLAVSLKEVKGDDSNLDILFKNQADKIQKEIDKLK